MPTTAVINAIELLKSDHQKVKGLFAQFEKAKDTRSKKKIVQEVITELQVHTTIEEEIFYPPVRKAIEDAGMMNEALEEHHVAKLLSTELEAMKGSEEQYEAKFMVLAENVRHHIQEEEEEMFPKVKKTTLDLEALGRKMSQRKAALMAEEALTTA